MPIPLQRLGAPPKPVAARPPTPVAPAAPTNPAATTPTNVPMGFTPPSFPTTPSYFPKGQPIMKPGETESSPGVVGKYEKRRLEWLHRLLSTPAPGNVLNISSGSEPPEAIAAMIKDYHTYMMAKVGPKGTFQVCVPPAMDPATAQANRFCLQVDSVQTFYDNTIGTLPTALIRIALASMKYNKDFLSDQFAPNEKRAENVIDKSKEELRVSVDQLAPPGKTLIDPVEVTQRVNRAIANEMASFLLEGHLTRRKGDNAKRPMVMEGLGDVDVANYPPEQDSVATQIGEFTYREWRDVVYKYLNPRCANLVQYAREIAAYYIKRPDEMAKLESKLGTASKYELVHHQSELMGGSQRLPMDATLGVNEQIPGWEVARRTFFAGQSEKGAKKVMIMNLANSDTNQCIGTYSTGEATTPLIKAIHSFQSVCQHSRRDLGGDQANDPRLLILITKKPLVETGQGSEGPKQNELQDVSYGSIPPPEPDEIRDEILPKMFAKELLGGYRFILDKNVIQPMDANGHLTEKGEDAMRRMARYLYRLSYYSIQDFVSRTVKADVDPRRPKDINFDRLLIAMREGYVEELFKKYGEAEGAQLKGQFEFHDCTRTRNYQLTDEMGEILRTHKRMVPLERFMENESLTKDSIENFMNSLTPPITPEELGYDSTRTQATPHDMKAWDELKAEDMADVGDALKQVIRVKKANCILLTGAGGNGKTLYAEYLAYVLGYGYLRWKVERSKGGIVGSSEKNLDLAFQFVSNLKEYVVVLDEIDGALNSGHGVNDNGVSNALVASFKSHFTDVLLPKVKTNNLIIISTTNHPERIDPPERRRIGGDATIEVGYAKSKEEIISLVDSIFERELANNPRAPQLLTLRDPYADELYRQASANRPYSKDEIGRLFNRWFVWNTNRVTLSEDPQVRAKAYSPETLQWTVRNSLRQSSEGALTIILPDLKAVGFGLDTPANVKDQPEVLRVPGYEVTQTRPKGPQAADVVPADEAAAAEDNTGVVEIGDEAVQPQPPKPPLPPGQKPPLKPLASKAIKLISIAETPHDLETGLKYARTMPSMSGMLFNFKHPRILNFWMQDCYLNLDIAFINSDNRIIKIANMIPLSTRSVSSPEPCSMALEVERGTLEEIGACVGKRLDIDFENKTVCVV